MKVKFVCLSIVIFLSSCSRESEEFFNSINISVPYELSTLDPHAKDTVSNFAALSNCYEPLVRTDANMKVVPALASSWESPDLNTWVFHLQKGVRFHSGKPLTTEDVVYSFERLLKDPNLEMKSYITSISEVKGINKSQVIIRTTRPVAPFLNKLNFVHIIPKDMGIGALAQKIDGTGPYKLVEWKKGTSIQITRNERYWGRKPPIKNVLFYLNQTPQQALDQLESENSQLVQCNLKTIRKVGESHSNYELLIHESPYVKYLAYDMKRDITPYCNVLPNPFKNPLVRQALDVAIDRRRLTDQLSTFAIPNPQPIPAFVFGFNPQLASAKHDLIYARQLLQQAGLAKGFDVTLHSRELLQETASLVQQQLQKINIRVRIELLPDEEFFEKLNRRDSTFYLSRLGCPTGDVSDLLEMALHSPEISKHFGTRNSGGYENPKLDEAIERTAGIVNVDQRLKALQQVMLWIHEDRPWIPLYIDQEVFALERHYVWKPRNDAYILAQEIGVQ